MYDKAVETMSAQDMRSLQTHRLIKEIKYCYDRVPLYRQRLDAAGIKPDDIRTLEDLAKLPFTNKSDLRDNYPYGLVAVDMDDVVRIHASSGTSGKPTVVAYTQGDLDMWGDCMARIIVAAGGKKSDIVQIAFGYGLFTGALGLHQGWEKLGATVIPASSGNTARQVMLIKDLGVTALVATPSYALYIAEVMEESGLSKDDLKLRIGLFGSEASSPEMHQELQDRLGLFPTDNYGLSEIIGPGVSGECQCKCGMHINEDHFYPEIIDPNTLKPLADGEWGELVITTLTKQGMPMLRYRTKDITRLIREKCACGRTTVRMDKIQGRSDDMLIIRGVNVFPSQIEGVLLNIAELGGGNYEIIVTRDGHMDKLEIRVELRDSSLLDNFSALEALHAKIRHQLKTVLQIDAVVKLVEPLSLKRYEGKAKRVTDLR